ncbi:MAG: hypothetical protein Q9217_005729 [Psora testacea]
MKGDARKDQSKAERDASHSIGKLGPYNVSASGGASKDDPRRTQGSWDQTVGAGKEAVGNAMGIESVKKEGQEQNIRGKGMEAEGQLSDFGSGVKGRVEGTVKGVGAGILGDREKEELYRRMHDDGKTAQRSAERDIQRSAEV